MGEKIAQLVKDLPERQETWVHFLGWEDPLEKEMALHSRILEWRTLQNYWRILWTEEPGVLQSRGSQKSDMTCLNHHPRMLQRNQLVVEILLLAGLV